jgi:hypothetical protein
MNDPTETILNGVCALLGSVPNKSEETRPSTPHRRHQPAAGAFADGAFRFAVRGRLASRAAPNVDLKARAGATNR